MIFEAVISTIDAKNEVNIAPMGVVTDDDFQWQIFAKQSFQLRPFAPSQTLENLQANRVGVINFVDDVLLIAKAALNELRITKSELTPAEKIAGYALAAAKSTFEFEVQSLHHQDNRWFANCLTVSAMNKSILPGFNRAQFAVLEATILATRLQWIPLDVYQQQRSWLESLVQKTGGEREKQAWNWLTEWVESRYGTQK